MHDVVVVNLRQPVEADGKADGGNLVQFANGHNYFGLHREDGSWVFREWAPNAESLYLVGDFCRWGADKAYAMTRIDDDGQWELHLPAEALRHGDLYRLRVHWPGGQGDRIPAYARRVVQDPDTLIFNAQVWRPPEPYRRACMLPAPSF